MTTHVAQPTQMAVSLKVIRANGAIEDQGVVAFQTHDQARMRLYTRLRAAGRTVTRAMLGAETTESSNG